MSPVPHDFLLSLITYIYKSSCFSHLLWISFLRSNFKSWFNYMSNPIGLVSRQWNWFENNKMHLYRSLDHINKRRTQNKIKLHQSLECAFTLRRGLKAQADVPFQNVPASCFSWAKFNQVAETGNTRHVLFKRAAKSVREGNKNK